MSRDIPDPIHAPALAEPTDSPAADATAQLHEAEQAIERLKKKFEAAERRANALQMQQQQILTSRSWRITAPLRGFRTLLGAPLPLAPLERLDVDGAAQPQVRWDSLIPQELRDKGLASDPDEAARSNELCEILRLDPMLDGLFPDALLAGRVPAAHDAQRPGAIHYGDRPSPARIAFLGSTELANELAFDAEVTPLAESGWEAQLAAGGFDLLLVEPVWHVDNRAWRSALSISGRHRPLVEALLAKAGEQGISRVLWYRAPIEDLEQFGWLATEVDAAYATDRPAASALAQYAGRKVDVLPPAIQPAMHNPFRSWEQVSSGGLAERVLFDGWVDLMEGASANPLLRRFKADRLLVGESEWQFGGVRLMDCPDFKRNAIGCLSAAGKIGVAKMVGAEVFRQSPLVPDWRRRTMMLRSIACGAVVAETAAGEAAWGELPLRGEADALGRRLEALLADPLARARLRHGAFREVFGSHCLADRLDTIAADLGLKLKFGRRPARVACLLVSMRPELLEGCLERFRADRYPHKELVVVLHTRDASLAQARALVRPGEPISVFQMGKEVSLGACLNFAAAQSDAEYWAKFDDDDLYGPEYLSDIMLYRRAVDFPVGGKSAAFTYLEAEDRIRWDGKCAERRSWQWRRPGRGERIHVAGGTLVGKREVLDAVPFSHLRRRGSDTDFLRRADAAGFGFTAFDFFNFALFRSAQDGFHTWNADLGELRQRTVAVGAKRDLDGTVFV